MNAAESRPLAASKRRLTHQPGKLIDLIIVFDHLPLDQDCQHLLDAVKTLVNGAHHATSITRLQSLWRPSLHVEIQISRFLSPKVQPYPRPPCRRRIRSSRSRGPSGEGPGV